MANMSSNPVIFIGAADAICAKAIKFFAAASKAPIVLADADEDAVVKANSHLPAGRATVKKVNIFEPAELRDLIAGAALVVLGAQPYYRTSGSVLQACLDAKVPYLDYSDDVTTTQDSLDLHERVKKEGVACYINCGASPGMTNLMAVDAAQDLDTVDSIDICWYVTDEGGQLGKEVLEHLMHITAGPCLTWAGGKAATHENWVETAYAPVESGGSEVLLHESIHPEPVTLPRRFPNANRIRCLGAINPAPINGIARGLSKAVHTGSLSMEAAIDFLYNLPKMSSSPGPGWTGALGAVSAQLRGGDITLKQLFQLASHAAGSLGPWRHAIWGLIEQVYSGDCSATEVVRFMIDSARGKPPQYRSGMMVRVLGTRNGHPAVVIRRCPDSRREVFGNGMDAEIGASCAAFILMALEEPEKRAGVFCPDEWADPQAFYKSMERLGCRPDQIVESFRA